MLLPLCAESVGMFEDCQVPDEIRVMSIPWAYKGTVNYPVLRVSPCFADINSIAGHAHVQITIMLHNVIFEGFRRIATRAAAAACMTVVISDHVATMRWVRYTSTICLSFKSHRFMTMLCHQCSSLWRARTVRDVCAFLHITQISRWSSVQADTISTMW